MAETPGSSGASDSHEFRRRACQFCKVFGKLQDLVYGPGSDDTLRERALGPLSSCYIGILEASHQLRYPELSTPGSAGAGTRQLLHHPRLGCHPHLDEGLPVEVKQEGAKTEEPFSPPRGKAQ